MKAASAALLAKSGSQSSNAIVAGSVTFGGNGTLTGTSYSGPANWYTPTTPGIGGSYWLRITRIDASPPGMHFSNAEAVWVHIQTGLLIVATGDAGYCSGVWEVSSNSIGTNILATGTIFVSNAF